MGEGRCVAVGEAALSGVATAEHSRERRVEQRGDARPDESRSDQTSVDATCIDDEIDALVRDQSRLVYRIAYAVLRRHHDAEDATQETFVRVLRYRSKLAAVQDTKTWLARIAWRVAVDRSRRQGQQREVALEDPEKPLMEVASAERPADETLLGVQIGAALERLIAALPGKLREPLILSTVEEMSPREVAATLGINEAAVRSRVFRARQILKEKLAQRTGSR